MGVGGTRFHKDLRDAFEHGAYNGESQDRRNRPSTRLYRNQQGGLGWGQGKGGYRDSVGIVKKKSEA